MTTNSGLTITTLYDMFGRTEHEHLNFKSSILYEHNIITM